MTGTFDYHSSLKEIEEGNEVSARALVEELYPLVIRIVRAHLPRQMDEEDLAQEIFMKMFARLSQYRAEQPFPHWMSRLAVTTCIDRLRFQQRRPEVKWADLSEEQAAFLEGTLEDRPTESAQNAEASKELVNRLLSELDPKDRLILNWLDIEERSVAEIQQQTGWGASFIKVRAMRARRRLRNKLEKLELTKESI